MLEEAINVADK